MATFGNLFTDDSFTREDLPLLAKVIDQVSNQESQTRCSVQGLIAPGLAATRNSKKGVVIVTTMGLKPSPSGESFRFLYWGDGKLPNEFAQSL